MRAFAFLALFIFLGMGLSYSAPMLTQLSTFSFPSAQYGLVSMAPSKAALLFGGDVMLGRAVEMIMSERGASFPFLNIRELIEEHDVAIVNFEGAVPAEHVPTPLNGFRFSIREDALSALAASGIDVLSLANNHAMDFGGEGLAHTKRACERADMACIGDPVTVRDDSIWYGTASHTSVSILALHTLFNEPGTTTLKAHIDTMEANSEIQIAFIHWGEEYKETHTDPEEALAHYLIDEGVDAVIGHHPHVAQDIEIYNGKPIFYSLGNLVFDQYFDPSVEEGYLVSIEITPHEILYTLIPYDSHDIRSQPLPMMGEARDMMLKKLLPTPYFKSEEAVSGTFRVRRD